MSALPGASLVVDVAVAAAAAPAVTGVIQNLKARLQGRRGPSVLQPYRELRRLWGKSTVAPSGTSLLYRIAPAVVVAAVGSCLVVVAAAAVPSALPIATPLGDDVVVVLGLLALARFVIALSAWDTANGFGLLGAARDLFVAVSAEAVMLLALALAALPAASTSLAAMQAATAGIAVWQTPTLWCGLLAFTVVAVTEMGRQPIDNPDTHLELTMIHEGPLLEYAGRDLAYLQWAASARHVVVITLLVGVFLPHPDAAALAGLTTLAWWAVVLVAVAVVETLLAKMRLLRVPVFLGTSAVVTVIGLSAWFLVSAS